MRDLFRDYGAAIGPTLAFVLGLLTLLAKHAFDKRAARKDAERRVKKIVGMVKLSPPPEFQGPQAALSHTEDVLTNMANMEDFFDRLAAIKAAIDAADKPVHEHASPETIIRFQKMRWHFDLIVNERTFFRKISTGAVPIEENFFNVKQGWNGLLEAASSRDVQLRYRTRKLAK